MAGEPQASADLVVAAAQFDRSLADYRVLAEAARTGPLHSQESLEQAARAFEELGGAEKRLSDAAQALGAALSAARLLQETQAQAVQLRAREIEQRTMVAADLLQRYGAIGAKAGDLNRHVVQLADKETHEGSSSDSALAAALYEVRARLRDVIADAVTLVAAAREADFVDIAIQVDALREQISLADSKVSALAESLARRSQR